MRTLNVKQLEKRLSKLEGGPKPPAQRIVVVFGEDDHVDALTFHVGCKALSSDLRPSPSKS